MNKSKNAILEDEAIKIYKEIREINKGKKISFSKWQCWGCMKFSDHKNHGSCIYNEPDTLRGYQLINKVFEKKQKEK